jgi:outer membrane protein assembly factor BamB
LSPDRIRVVVLAAAVVAAAVLLGRSFADGSAAAPATYDWTSYSGGDSMANDGRSFTITPATAPKLTTSWSRTLDGAVFSSPLYLRTGVPTPLAFVATMGNTLYALAARNGSIVWKRSLGPPQPTVCHSSYGIGSTPYIDKARGRIYVIGARGALYAFDVRTGKTIKGWPLQIVKRTDVEFAWSGLRMRNGLLYVNVASYCDVPDDHGKPADGYTVAVDASHAKIASRIDLVPGPSNMGGAWGYGGVSIARDGSVYLATGNSVIIRSGHLIESAGLAEAVVHLSAQLRVLQSGKVRYKAAANVGDEDFGATPLLFQPKGCVPLVAANSKNGYAYVWRRSDLRSPVWMMKAGPTSANEPFLGEPSYDAATRELVVSESVFATSTRSSRGVSAFVANSRCSNFAPLWNANVGGGAEPPPLITGGVVFAAIATQRTVYAIDLKTGVIVWSKAIGASQAPISTNGRSVFIGTSDGTISAFAPAG